MKNDNIENDPKQYGQVVPKVPKMVKVGAIVLSHCVLM